MLSDILTIHTYPTYYEFVCTRDGTVTSTGGNIRTFISKMSEWSFDPRTEKHVVAYRYMLYDQVATTISFPINTLGNFIRYITDMKIPHNLLPIAYVQPKTVSIDMQPDMTPRENQTAIIDYLCSDIHFKALAASTSIGKGLAHGTPVRIPGGWTKVEDLKVGDIVTAWDGTPSKVTGVFPQGIKTIYRVWFTDDRYLDVDDTHLWQIHEMRDSTGTCTDGTPRVMDTLEMKGLRESRASIAVPHPKSEKSTDTARRKLLKELLGDDYARLQKSKAPNIFDTLVPTESKALEIQTTLRSFGWWCDMWKITDSKYAVRALRNNDTKKVGYPLLYVSHVEILKKKQEVTCIAIDHPDKLFIAGDWVVTHNTVVSMFTMSRLQHPTIVFTSNLLQQWRDQLLEKTLLTEDDVYVIKGHSTLEKLHMLDPEVYQPKVFVASIRTMSTYAKADPNTPYAILPSYLELQKKFGIGITIVDEVHENFHANTTIALRSRVKNAIYLSATYGRSNREGARIFSLVFPKETLYEQFTAKRHVQVTMAAYTLGNPHFSKDARFITRNGYSHHKYEGRILNTPTMLSTFLSKVIDQPMHFYLANARPGEKILIFGGTVNMVDTMGAYIAARWPQLKTICFYGDGGDDLLDDVQVIISTLKKSSTGRDIKKLRVVVNSISYKSDILAQQMLGRLRPLPDGTDTFMFDFYNAELSTHVRHQRDRRMAYASKAKMITDQR